MFLVELFFVCVILIHKGKIKTHASLYQFTFPLSLTGLFPSVFLLCVFVMHNINKTMFYILRFHLVLCHEHFPHIIKILQKPQYSWLISVLLHDYSIQVLVSYYYK